MIPATAHLIWFGRTFPWIYALSVRSAALRGGFHRVVLHHADDLGAEPACDELQRLPGVELRGLHATSLLEDTGDLGARLVDVYRRLSQPAARANMVRAALLFRQGGVYLDTDTVTLRPLSPLLDTGVFCGVVPVALPTRVVYSRHPLRWLRAAALLVLRDAFRRHPSGHLLFPAVSRLYDYAPNNAVLGAAPGNRLIGELLQGMVEMDRDRQRVRYALGTHLLEDCVAAYRGGDLTLHPQEAFYPLAPEISEHWFRMRRRVDLDRVLRPVTRLVHWCASVRAKRLVPLVDAAYVERNASRQLFSAMVLPLIKR